MRLIDNDTGLPVVFSNANHVSFGSTDPPTITAFVSPVTTGIGAVSAGAVNATSGTVVFSNSNGVTFGFNGQTVTASGSNPSVTAIQAGTQTATSGTIMFSNSNGVTFGMSGSATVTASAVFSPILSLWCPYGPGDMIQFGNILVFGAGVNAYVYPLVASGIFPGVMTVNTMLFAFSGFGFTTANSGSQNLQVAIYTLNGSTLSLLNSASTQIIIAPVSNQSTVAFGARWLSFHSSQWSVQPVFSQTMYWMMVNPQAVNSQFGLGLICATGFKAGAPWGTIGINATNSNTSQAMFPFTGMLATASPPTSITLGQLQYGLSANGFAPPYVIFNNGISSF